MTLVTETQVIMYAYIYSIIFAFVANPLRILLWGEANTFDVTRL